MHSDARRAAEPLVGLARRIVWLAIIVMAASVLPCSSAGLADESVARQILPVQMQDGIAFLPLRSFEGSGAQVDWWPDNQTAVVRAGGRLVLLSPRTDAAWTAAGTVELSRRPFFDRGRLMVPAEDVAGLLGMGVESVSSGPSSEAQGDRGSYGTLIIGSGAQPTCPHCGQSFGSQSQLHAHLNQRLYACIRYPDCGFTATTLEEVVRHYRSQPAQRSPEALVAGNCRTEAVRLDGWRMKLVPECPGMRHGNYTMVSAPDTD